MKRLFSVPKNNSARIQTVRKRVAVLFTTLVTALAPLTPFMLGRANAVADTTPVQLASLSISDSTIDATNTAHIVTMSGTVTDDLSGLGNVILYYSSPSGIQISEAELSALSQTSFAAQFTIPRYAEAGTWVPSMTFADNSGNTSDYTNAELTGLGYELGITVTDSNQDVTAPTATSLTQDREQVDTSISSDQTILTLVASDALAGISSAKITYTSPSANIQVSGDFAETPVAGTYSINAEFGGHVEVGRWNAQLTLVDGAGNTKLYDTADLTTAGFPDGIDVVGDPDVTPVAIESLGFAPIGENAQEVPVSGATFMLSGVLNDNLTGIEQVELIYRSQTTSQITYSYSVYEGSGLGNRDFYIVTPPYAAEGEWLPELYTRDLAGNAHTYTNAELIGLGYNLAVTLGQSVSGMVATGGTISTDVAATGATIADPVQTAVTTPTGGTVSVVRIDTVDHTIENGGYNFFGTEYNINAPAATASAPLVMTFTVDASKLDGIDVADIVIFRDGLPIEDCLTPTVADPDPCVKSRTAIAGGDAEVVVNTSHASNWAVGYEKAPTAPYQFVKFKKPVKEAPHLNKVEAGESIPVKFSIGGDYGMNILVGGSPTSQKINCTTKAVIGDASDTESTHSNGLTYKANGFYRYNWKTIKKWKNTCRQFTLNLTNGEVVHAYFKFKD